MSLTGQDIRRALRSQGLSGRAVCLHSSLKSFGRVEGGAASVVRAFVDEGCTLVVPAFSSAFEAAPPASMRFERNGWDYEREPATRTGSGAFYEPESSEIDREMGAIPAAVLAHPGRVRGRHPLDSFAAVGPRAAELIRGQTPSDVYAPLAALANEGGFVLLAGVGLERMTLLHLAEKEAGRELFRRWSRDARGETFVVEVGGCSEGFGKLAPHLETLARTALVGRSAWTLLPAARTLAAAAEAIRADPSITHCGSHACERCRDAVEGGPVVT